MKKTLLFAFIALVAALSPLAAQVKVLAFAGSARKDSYNKKLVLEAAEIARNMGAAVTIIDLKEYPMPFYDADLETKDGMPKNAQRFRDLLIRHDAVIIASPNYNSSIPAVLKNAIDWASRGVKGGSSEEAFKGKKFAIMSASPGKKGGAPALVHLRTILEEAGATVIPTQVSIPRAHEYFAQKERLENPALKEEIRELLEPEALLK